MDNRLQYCNRSPSNPPAVRRSPSPEIQELANPNPNSFYDRLDSRDQLLLLQAQLQQHQKSLSPPRDRSRQQQSPPKDRSRQQQQQQQQQQSPPRDRSTSHGSIQGSHLSAAAVCADPNKLPFGNYLLATVDCLVSKGALIQIGAFLGQLNMSVVETIIGKGGIDVHNTGIDRKRLKFTQLVGSSWEAFNPNSFATSPLKSCLAALNTMLDMFERGCNSTRPTFDGIIYFPMTFSLYCLKIATADDCIGIKKQLYSSRDL
jgi:hypothetical protein